MSLYGKEGWSDSNARNQLKLVEISKYKWEKKNAKLSFSYLENRDGLF